MPRPFVRVHYRVPGPGGEPVDRSIVFDTPWSVEGEVHPAFVEAEARRRLADVPVWEAVGWEFAYSPRNASAANRSRGRNTAGGRKVKTQAEKDEEVRQRVEAARARGVEAAAGIDLGSYDYVIVAFSGGKDSLACLLHLFDLGVDPNRVELWHYDVDGREGSKLMDWPVTRDYVRKVGEAFGVKTYFAWRVGGFEAAMLRLQAPAAATAFETPDKGVQYRGGEGKPSTDPRERGFPRLSGSLMERWCSSYLKVEVASISLNNQERFHHRRTLFLTGERAQESPNRAEYEVFEPSRSDNRHGKTGRHVDHWRPVLGWWEKEVWEIIERYRVNPHPTYRLGWGRVSCSACIFGSPDQFASLQAIMPEQFAAVAALEERFGKTIKTQKVEGKTVRLPLLQFIEKGARGVPGRPYPTMTEADARAAVGDMFDEPVILAPGEWRLPAGAFGESCGPT